MIGQRLRAGVVLLFVFALGGLSGVVLERHRSVPTPATLSAAEEHEAAMAELREVLGLDDRQVEQIHAVMAEHQVAVQQAWEQLRPEVQSAMREVHMEIARILRPEQRERYNDWVTRHHDEGEHDTTIHDKR